MRGHGFINTSNSTFTGELMCDPATVGANCGATGRYWCGSDASCARGRAIGNNPYFSMVVVAALPISSITTIR